MANKKKDDNAAVEPAVASPAVSDESSVSPEEAKPTVEQPEADKAATAPVKETVADRSAEDSKETSAAGNASDKETVELNGTSAEKSGEHTVWAGGRLLAKFEHGVATVEKHIADELRKLKMVK